MVIRRRLLKRCTVPSLILELKGSQVRFVPINAVLVKAPKEVSVVYGKHGTVFVLAKRGTHGPGTRLVVHNRGRGPIGESCKGLI